MFPTEISDMTKHPSDGDKTPLLIKDNTSCSHSQLKKNVTPSPPKFESLDFDQTINSYTISDAKSHPRYLQITITRWILVALVGLFTGITAVVIVHFVELLVQFRVTRLNSQLQHYVGLGSYYNEDEVRKYYHHEVSYFDSMLSKYGLGGIYSFYMGYNLFLVVLSTMLCIVFAPMAVGSGLPEVKAYLNGVRVGKFSGFRLFVVKLLGTILGVASGLVVGPEGPIVHLGAILGASLTKTRELEDWFCRKSSDAKSTVGVRNENSMMQQGDHRSLLSFFRNDLERRHLISIGAAAGFSSAFGAPVGGLLYSMEEASSFFSHDMLWKTLTATCIATFCIACYYGSLSRYSMLSLEIGLVDSSLTHLKEIPTYFVLGAAGGIIGSAFNRLNAYTNKLRKVFYGTISDRGKLLTFRVAESAFLSLLTSFTMLSAVIFAGRCRPGEKDGEEFRFLHRYNCPPGQTSELGILLFGSREESIKEILTDPENFSPNTLLTVGLLVLSLMVITFGVALPTGMFMPSILTGSSLGGYAGLIFKKYYISSIHPSDFSLIGAAAFLAGSQRNIVSLCVILMEGTGNTKSIIPVIITVVCARTIGDFLSEGIYEELIQLRDYPYLKHESKPQYDIYTARTIMSSAVTISSGANAGLVEDLLLEAPHNAFPVVEKKSGSYIGMVRRDQLVAALENKLYMDNPSDEEIVISESNCNLVDIDENNLSSLKNAAFHVDDGVYRSIADWRPTTENTTTLSWVNGNVVISIPPHERFRFIDVGSIMNKSAICVQEDSPLSRVFNIFTSLGLRHLPVVSTNGTAVGVITRFNLSDAYISSKLSSKCCTP